MKFFAEPKHFVKINNKYMQRALGIKGLFFDDNGEYVTYNELLINTLKIHFKYEDNNLPIEEAKEPSTAQGTANTDIVEEQKETSTTLEVPNVDIVEETTKEYSCKNCDATFENKGKYLAHLKTHKKGV